MPSGEGQEIPPGFWDLPAVRDALDRRDLGKVLALLIEQDGLSQHALAAMLEMSQPRVWGYIHGRHRPTMDTIAAAADRLGMPPHARQRLGLARPSAVGSTGGPRVRLSQVLALAEHIGRTGDTAGLDAWREAARARAPGDAWARLAAALSVHPPDELRAAERIRACTRGFFLAAAKLPARLVIEALTAHAADIGLLLDAVPDPHVRRELTSLSGEAGYLLACCDVDLGDPGGALDGLGVTEKAARSVGDAGLAAMALDGHSHFRAFGGDRTGALALVQEGLQKAEESGSIGTRVYLELRSAEESVALGQIGRAARAWGRAEAGYVETDLGTDRDWTRLWLAPDCFDSVRAVIYASTGRADDAVAVARAVAGRLAGALGKSDAIALVNAAFALAAAGEFSAAASAGREALQAVRASEATGCMPRVDALAQLIRGQGRITRSGRAFLDDAAATRRQLDALRAVG